MAYGSPERLEDVPAYYADIRGGRPIAPEHLEDLVARYRRLGIEDSNPLNAITERTRAALERELGLPVFTGMKHWTPRIADAVAAALAGGATQLVGLVLAPHYSRLSIGGYQRLLDEAVDGRVPLALRRQLARRPRLRLGPRRPHPRDDRSRRLHGSLAAGAHPRRGRPVRRPAARDRAARRGGGRRVANGRSPTRANRRPASRGSSPTSSSTSGELHERRCDEVLVCPVGFVSDHLEIRFDLDTEAQELAARARHERRAHRDAERRPRVRPGARRDRAQRTLAAVTV